MHSALRPYITTGLAIVGSSVMALAPIAPPPPAPAAAATTANQVSNQAVTLSAKVITINPTPQALDMADELGGSYCSTPGVCVELEYKPVWTSLGQFGYGVEALKEALAGYPGEDITIFGFSEGATVASQWLEAHLEDPAAYPAPQNLTFVVIGNPNRKYGGSATSWGRVWPENSGYHVIDVMNQYDPTGDLPDNPFNVLAALNATMGFFTNHLGDSYYDVDIDDPANSRWEEDGIEYVFVPSKTLPLLEPLRWLGLNELADDMDAPLRYLIEQGYDRDPRIELPAPEAKPSIFNVPINLMETLGNIPFNAVAGTNRFANAMRASGSWWVYTPVNVLGWDPANPEMTRAFVDFLIAIPSISGPMGEIADYWARANLPMNEGCSGFPPCDNPDGITDQMFKVMLWDLFSPEGYTFEGPITPTHNPVSANEGYWGQELGEVGDPVSWYGETVYLEPFAEMKSFWEYLNAPPEGIKTPTLSEQFGAAKNLFEALMVTWYPFVPQSTAWNPEMTPFAYLTRPFAKLLCPTCNKVDPFMPPSWKVGDDVPPGAYIPKSVKDLYDKATGKYIGPPIEDSATVNALVAGEETTATDEVVDEETEETPAAEEKTDVISTAVQGLLDKFDKTPETPEAETPAAETPAEETPAAEDDGTQAEKDAAEKAAAEKEAAEKEAAEKEAAEKEAAEKEAAEKEAAEEEAAAEKEAAEKEAADKEAADRADADKDSKADNDNDGGANDD